MYKPYKPKPTRLDARTRYNQAVTAALRASHPLIADRLSSRGESLGWWNTIHYWQTTNVPVEKAVGMLVEMNKTADGL